MELATRTDVRDFKIRGNYFNLRGLLSRSHLHSANEPRTAPNCPGYSPPVVDFELLGAATGSIAVSESDIPMLTDHDLERAKRNLSLILQARQGDSEAAEELSSTAQNYLPERMGQLQPAETSFVVPCTSCEPHAEQAISQKASILLKLCQLGYPVPEF